MTIISIIIGLVSVGFGIWRFYYAPKTEKRKLQKEVRKIRKKMRKALRAGCANEYNDLEARRMRLNLRIKQLGKRRGFFGR